MNEFQPGEVVQLRSGGSLLTVCNTIESKGEKSVICTYQNPISGCFEKVSIHADCLKCANDRPANPQWPTKSSLS